MPSSSLVPEGDPSTLFTSAGMQSMIPYLLGQNHPAGKRVVNSQKCFRSQDILEVGDNRHTTFFEMLGNWSFGDYFKEEQLTWLFEFLTSKLKLNPDNLYITAFSGNKEVPQDNETIRIWQKILSKAGINAEIGKRIFLYGNDKNWWSRFDSLEKMPEGEPGGPDSEVFFLFDSIDHNAAFGKTCHPNCECGRFLEIANSVFMQYQKKGGKFTELPQKNVDFGGGLERLVAATLNQPDIFQTDLFSPIIDTLSKNFGKAYGENSTIDRVMRIVADHIKASSFLIKEGVVPGNKMQSYVLRRLLRRIAVKIHSSPLSDLSVLPNCIDKVVDVYKDTGYFMPQDPQKIKSVVEDEISKFQKTLERGFAKIQKIDKINEKTAFDLYQSYGFPFEILQEIFLEKGQAISKEGFDAEFEKHRQTSKDQAD